jgi:hypothetical protein
MFNRVIAVILGLGAVVFVLLLGGVGSAMLTDDPPAESQYASGPGAIAEAQFAVSAVAFGEAGYVEVTNVGDADGTLDGYWLCQFPSYFEISGTIGPGETAQFEVSASSFGRLDDGSGEIGLYVNAGFDDPSAIVAYVEWGEPGHGRSGTAVEAGVWTANSAVDAAGAAIIVAVEDAPARAEGWGTE